MEDKQTTMLETRSAASCSGKSSNSSTTSKAAAIARAKAEATRTQVTFAKKEMEMKLERARVDASLELNVEKEAAAAIAEAEVLEAAADTDGEKRSSRVDLPLETEDPIECTSQYVHQHPTPYNSHPSMPDMETISELGYGPSMPHHDEQKSFIPTPHYKEIDDNTAFHNIISAHQPVKAELTTGPSYPAGERQGGDWISTRGFNDFN